MPLFCHSYNGIHLLVFFQQQLLCMYFIIFQVLLMYHIATLQTNYKIHEWPSYAFEAFQSQYRVVHDLSITNFFLTFFPNINFVPFFQNSDVASGQGRGGARFYPCMCIIGCFCLPVDCKCMWNPFFGFQCYSVLPSVLLLKSEIHSFVLFHQLWIFLQFF